jgi:hypothetical protein
MTQSNLTINKTCVLPSYTDKRYISSTAASIARHSGVALGVLQRTGFTIDMVSAIVWKLSPLAVASQCVRFDVFNLQIMLRKTPFGVFSKY